MARDEAVAGGVARQPRGGQAQLMSALGEAYSASTWRGSRRWLVDTTSRRRRGRPRGYRG